MAKSSRIRLSEELKNSTKKLISLHLKKLIINKVYTKAEIAKILKVETRAVENYINELSLPESDILILMMIYLGLDLSTLNNGPTHDEESSAIKQIDVELDKNELINYSQLQFNIKIKE